MTVENVLGHTYGTLAPNSVPAVAVSSYLRKAWLPSPTPSLHSPRVSPAQQELSVRGALPIPQMPPLL